MVRQKVSSFLSHANDKLKSKSNLDVLVQINPT